MFEALHFSLCFQEIDTHLVGDVPDHSSRYNDQRRCGVDKNGQSTNKAEDTDHKPEDRIAHPSVKTLQLAVETVQQTTSRDTVEEVAKTGVEQSADHGLMHYSGLLLG